MMNQSNGCNFCDKEFITQEHRDRKHRGDRDVARRSKHWDSDCIFTKDCSSFRKKLRNMLDMITPLEEDVQSWELLEHYFNKEECQFEEIVVYLRNATAGGRSH
jgi:hypothetical protein